MNLSEQAREKRLEYTRRWRERNPEAVRRGKMKWLQIPENRMRHCLMQAKRRAIDNGIEFSVTVEDLLPLPVVCPVLGVEINYKGTGARGFINNSPSVDRVDISKGYIKGNVMVICWRANRIKSDASIAELEQVLSYMKEHTK